MKTRPEISEEEIRGLMDFDSLVAKHKALTHSRAQWIKFTSIAVATILVGTSAYFIYQHPSKTTPSPSSKQHISTPIENTTPGEVKNSTGSSADTSLAIQEVAPIKVERSTTNKRETKSNEKTSSALAVPTQEKEKEKTTPGTETQTNAYHQAEPEKGFPHLYEYFNTQIRYPEQALKDSTQGVVSVSFILDTKGMPTQIQVQNSLGKPFDDEAIRLVQNMPRWKPATFNGKATPAKMTLPITFSIQRIKSVQQ